MGHPDSAQILLHLERLERSSGFAGAPRMQRLLRRLARPLLDGSEPPKELTLGIEVFDRPPDWDPASDSVVRVNVSRLRLKLLEAYDGPLREEPLRFALPKGRYALEALPSGLQSKEGPAPEPPSPRGELLPHPESASPVAAAAPQQPLLGRRSLLAAGLTLAAGAGSYRAFRGGSAGLGSRSSVTQISFEYGDIMRARLLPGHRSLLATCRWADEPTQVRLGEFAANERLSWTTVPAFANRFLCDVSPTGSALTLATHRSLELAESLADGSHFKPLASGVLQACWLPSGRILLLRYSAAATVLQYLDGETILETHFASQPNVLEVSPDGRFAAWTATASPGAQVMLADLVTRQARIWSEGWQVLGVPFWESPTSVILCGRKAGKASLTRLRTTGRPEENLEPVGGRAWNIQDRLADGRLLAAAQDTHLEARTFLPGAAGESTLSGFLNPAVRAMSGDGRLLLLEEYSDSPLHRLHLMPAGGRPLLLGEGRAPAMSAGGEIAWLEGAPDRSVLVVRSESGVLQRFPLRHPARSLVWASSGSSLLIHLAGARSGGTVEFNTATGSVRDVDPRLGTVACVSPLRWGVLTGTTTPRLIHLDSLATRDLGAVDGAWKPLRWSPDGRDLWLAIVPPDRASLEIMRLGVDTARRETVARLRPRESAGVYTMTLCDIDNSGSHYAYTYQRDVGTLFLLEPGVLGLA